MQRIVFMSSSYAHVLIIVEIIILQEGLVPLPEILVSKLGFSALGRTSRLCSTQLFIHCLSFAFDRSLSLLDSFTCLLVHGGAIFQIAINEVWQ